MTKTAIKIAKSNVFNTLLSATIFGTGATITSMLTKETISIQNFILIVILLSISFTLYQYVLLKDDKKVGVKFFLKAGRDFLLNILFAAIVSVYYGELSFSPEQICVIILTFYILVFVQVYLVSNSLIQTMVRWSNMSI